MVDFLERKKDKTSKIRDGDQKKGHNLARKYTTILKIKINSSEPVELLNAINLKIEDGDRFLVVTPNPEIIMLAQSDPFLASCLNSAELSLADGVGLIWASKISNFKFQISNLFSGSQIPNAFRALKERVSGVDVMGKLIEMAAERGWRVFLLGGRVGVAEAAAAKLIINQKSLIINHDPGPWLGENGEPVNKEEGQREKEVIEKINKFKPHLLFVGFGAPKQEKWASRRLGRLDVNCVMVVGGTFDYISGRLPRAPLWLRNIGLEWLFRLVVEPWRIRRQFALIRFAWAIVTSNM